MNCLRIENLSFHYSKDIPILNSIDLTIKQGEQFAILGKNGAGKSTLSKLITGLLRPCYGNIFINELNTNTLTTAQISKHIGYIFQNPDDQIFNSTVKKEITYGLSHISKDEYQEIIQLTGLKDKEELSPFDLSLSERKFVNIASTLLRNPSLIIFDEVTGGQDQIGKQTILSILKWLKEKNKTIFFITHDINFVSEHFQNTIILGNKTLLFKGKTIDAFIDSFVLETASLEQPTILQLSQKLGFDAILNEKDLIQKILETQQ